MTATKILTEIYHSYIGHFGEPDSSICFENDQTKKGFPERVDVFIWDADEEVDITTFATIGMADQPMSNESRCELHFSIRQELSDSEKHEVATFLANVAMYPFYNETYLDWWHKLNNPGEIPIYKTAQALLLHPAFIEDGYDTIETSEGYVKIINLVPITQQEQELKDIDLILTRLESFDIFKPR